MTILARPARFSKRTFGEGILEPEPKPVRVRDVRKPAPKPAPQPVPKPEKPVKVPAWVSAVTHYLTSDAYTPGDVAAALAWVEARRMIDGCPVVSPADWPAVNELLRKNAVPSARALEVEAILAAEAPAASWPASADAYRWVPTDAVLDVEVSNEDSAWASQTAPAAVPGRTAVVRPAPLVSVVVAPARAFRFAPNENPDRIDRMFSSAVTDVDILSPGQND